MSAATYNKFIDAAKASQQQKLDSANGGGFNSNTNIAYIRNDTGAAVGMFNILGVGNLVMSPSGATGQIQQNIVLACVSPSGGNVGNFVVTAEPISTGAIGHAYIDGVFPVQVNVSSGIVGASGDFADVSSGSLTALSTSASGSAKIMTRQGGAGIQWALCRMATAPPAAGVPTPTATGQMLTTTDGANWSVITPTTNGQVAQVASGVPTFKLLELT